MNSRQFFAPKQDTLKRNQSGGSVGGPIVKGKLFYFGTYQGTRVNSTAEGLVQFVPTEAQRRGDFSSTPTQLVDPVSRQPLVNNQIPANRISPVTQYFLKYIPLPNGPDGRLTFPATPLVQNDNQLMSKIDYHVSKHQMAGRYFFTDYDEPVVVPSDNILAASNQAKAVRVQNVSINHTYVASPTLLFNSTFGMNRQRGGSTSTAPFGFREAGARYHRPGRSSRDRFAAGVDCQRDRRPKHQHQSPGGFRPWGFHLPSRRDQNRWQSRIPIWRRSGERP